ncbi:uncharacterized protein PS065_016621 [Dugong dugon]
MRQAGSSVGASHGPSRNRQPAGRTRLPAGIPLRPGGPARSRPTCLLQVHSGGALVPRGRGGKTERRAPPPGSCHSEQRTLPVSGAGHGASRHAAPRPLQGLSRLPPPRRAPEPGPRESARAQCKRQSCAQARASAPRTRREAGTGSARPCSAVSRLPSCPSAGRRFFIQLIII